MSGIHLQSCLVGKLLLIKEGVWPGKYPWIPLCACAILTVSVPILVRHFVFSSILRCRIVPVVQKDSLNMAQAEYMVDQPLDAFIQSKKRGRGSRGKSRGFRGGNRQGRGAGGFGRVSRGSRGGRGFRRGGRQNRVRVYSISCNL